MQQFVTALIKVINAHSHVLAIDLHAHGQSILSGRVQVGADADIVVFDLAKVMDQATYENPAQPSTGFHYVLVNGVPLVEEQQFLTSVPPGKAIRRPIKTSFPKNLETRDAR